MKLFKKSSTKGPFLLSELTETTDGTLIAKLLSSEHHNLVESYLMALRTEFRVANQLPNSFAYEYDQRKGLFIITPKDASPNAIMDNLRNLLQSDSPRGDDSPRPER